MANPFRPLLQRAVNAAWSRGWIRGHSTSHSLAHAAFVRQQRYKGAESGRLTASWARNPTTADREILLSLRTLRARSRQMARDSGYMRRFLGLTQTNVVGPNGIILQAAVKRRNGKPRQSVNRAIEAGWHEWGRDCDHLGNLSWLGLNHVGVSTVAEDGELLIELIPSDASKYGCKILAIDPELLDVEYNQENQKDGSYVRMSIEYGSDGKRRGYWLRDQSKDGRTYEGDTFFRSGKAYRWVPAERMIHAFLPARIGQTRGIPWAHAVMWKTHMQDGYEDAAVTNARIGASKMGFFTNNSGQPYKGTAKDAQGNPLIDGFEPGGIETLPEGVEFASFNPDYPHAQFGDFSKHMLQGISAGLGVSYHSLANDLEGVNFSSIRAGVLEDRECWKALQTWWIDTVIRPIYEFWLRFALAKGALVDGGGTLLLTKFEEYKQATWQPRRWAWVDPLKDMQANQLAYDIGATSLSAIIRETGRDPEEVWSERQREAELMSQFGVTPISQQPTQEVDPNG